MLFRSLIQIRAQNWNCSLVDHKKRTERDLFIWENTIVYFDFYQSSCSVTCREVTIYGYPLIHCIIRAYWGISKVRLCSAAKASPRVQVALGIVRVGDEYLDFRVRSSIVSRSELETERSLGVYYVRFESELACRKHRCYKLETVYCRSKDNLVDISSNSIRSIFLQ